jgi:hypothetical protein
MRVELSRQWERAKIAAQHALRHVDCAKKASRVLTIDNPTMRELLLREIEDCMQKARPSAL